MTRNPFTKTEQAAINAIRNARPATAGPAYERWIDARDAVAHLVRARNPRVTFERFVNAVSAGF